MPSYSTKQIQYEPFALCELFPPEDPHTFDEPDGMDGYEARWERVMDPLDLQTVNGLHALVFAFLHHVKVDPHEFTHILTFAEAAVRNGDTVETDRRFDDHVGHYRPDLIRATHATKPGCWLVFHRTKAMLKLMQLSRATLNRRLADGKPHHGPNATPLVFTVEVRRPLLAHRDAVWTPAQVKEQLTYTHEELRLE